LKWVAIKYIHIGFAGNCQCS